MPWLKSAHSHGKKCWFRCFSSTMKRGTLHESGIVRWVDQAKSGKSFPANDSGPSLSPRGYLSIFLISFFPSHYFFPSGASPLEHLGSSLRLIEVSIRNHQLISCSVKMFLHWSVAVVGDRTMQLVYSMEESVDQALVAGEYGWSIARTSKVTDLGFR